MANLYLIRHGESKGNKEQLVTGSSSDPLTDKGREQVRLLKNYIFKQQLPKPTLIVSSAMKRAIETAELLYDGIPIVQYADLNETDAGDVSCWKKVDFGHAFPEFWTNFDPSRSFPGGESHSDLYSRVVLRTIKLLSTSKLNDNIYMVVHGGTISCILHHAYDVSMQYFSRFVLDNASITMLRFQDNLIPPELVHFNLNPKDWELERI